MQDPGVTSEAAALRPVAAASVAPAVTTSRGVGSMIAARPAQDPGRNAGLIDGCGRRIDHLRLSVTAACDLRCSYCRPADLASSRPGLLSDEQRVTFLQFLQAKYGLTQVRITGGEPLVYPTLLPLIASIRAALPDLSIAMTTNARRLTAHATALREAGVGRLNVSLDSVDAARYREMTGGDLGLVLSGLDAAVAAGFPPPRINAVVIRGSNHLEVPAIARWALERGFELRFLEAMPIGPASGFNRERFVPAREIVEALREEFDLTPLAKGHGETARRYQVNGAGASGVIGLIAPVTEPFCSDCRRIRLTEDGKLYPCLLDSRYVDMKGAWLNGAWCTTTAAQMLEDATGSKLPRGPQEQAAPMITLGG